jgi:hypothetical protein
MHLSCGVTYNWHYLLLHIASRHGSRNVAAITTSRSWRPSSRDACRACARSVRHQCLPGRYTHCVREGGVIHPCTIHCVYMAYLTGKGVGIYTTLPVRPRTMYTGCIVHYLTGRGASPRNGNRARQASAGTIWGTTSWRASGAVYLCSYRVVRSYVGCVLVYIHPTHIYIWCVCISMSIYGVYMSTHIYMYKATR